MLSRKDPWLRKLEKASKKPQVNRSAVHFISCLITFLRKTAGKFYFRITMCRQCLHLISANLLTVDEKYNETIYCSLSNMYKEELG